MSFSNNVGSQDSPGAVTGGDRVKISNDTANSFIVIQIRDASEGMGGPPIGPPIVILPGASMDLVIPDLPALAGLTFELDPDKWTPDGNGGLTHDPLSGT